MKRCKSCSAPLDGIFCDYCGSRNNVDLGHFRPMNVRPHQQRPCPVCHTNMSTIDVGEKVPFLIERCESCMGLFFDKEELESMIDMTVKGGRNVNLNLLQELTENPRYVDVVVYRRCPVCRKHMQRRNFGRRSGVIMDECVEHGIWLDPGELRQIMEWVKAGGLKRAEAPEQPRSSYTECHTATRRKSGHSRHYHEHERENTPAMWEELFALLRR
ncbi:zf-TFIIB domain-containing protein [Sulfurimonas sp. HSL-1656]|uniref:TFIIB-type zinc ribbon-containing protein n=1 Tax=Thiomicrolovo subterrani TaxID=3131934 RepID=UPI0031F8F9CD